MYSCNYKQIKLHFNPIFKVLLFYLVLFINYFWHPGKKTDFSMSSFCYNQPPNKHTIIVSMHVSKFWWGPRALGAGGINFRKTICGTAAKT